MLKFGEFETMTSLDKIAFFLHTSKRGMNHPNETPKLQTVLEGLNLLMNELMKKNHAWFLSN